MVLAIVLIGFGSVQYGFLRSALYSDLDTRIRNDVEEADDSLPEFLSAKRANSDRAAGLMSVDKENWLIEVWSKDLTRVFTNTAPETFPLGKFDAGCLSKREPSEVHRQDGLNVRVFCQESSSFRGEYMLRAARLDEKNDGILNRYRRLVVLAGPIALMLAALFGYFLAKKSLAPVDRLVTAAESISALSLAQRLPVHNSTDELGRLAETFNRVFERLEKSFQQMRRFSSDASHELRTPLAAIRALGENALMVEKTSHRETIASILEETDRLRHLCENLLLLSRADSGQLKMKSEKIDLYHIAQRTIDLLSILAEEKHQILTLHGEVGFAFCIADETWVRQAITNLLDNAIKYSPVKSTIEVRVGINTPDGISGAYLMVVDDGPGIGEDHREKIFDRFYRADAARGREAGGGAGLGLAIAKWAVETFGGTLCLEQNVPVGTAFTILFPNSKQT
jgi:heavy metal sensor kinase